MLRSPLSLGLQENVKSLSNTGSCPCAEENGNQMKPLLHEGLDGVVGAVLQGGEVGPVLCWGTTNTGAMIAMTGIILEKFY